MTKITRPPLDRVVFQKRFAAACEALPGFIESVRDRPYNVDLVLVKALEVAQYGIVVEPTSGLIGKALQIAAQANAAIFTMARAGGKTVEFPLENSRLVVSSPAVDEAAVHPSKWMQGFFLASLCRNGELLESLCETPTEMLRRSTTVSPEYMYLFVDALRDYQRNVTGRAEKILAALRATDPSRPDIEAEEWVLYIDVRLLEMFFCINGKDMDFGGALQKALEQHKEYWTKTEKRAKDWRGFLPLGILGLTAIAYDQRLPFDVESEYLPMDLVRGDFLRRVGPAAF
jgi:hypothetical protein